METENIFKDESITTIYINFFIVILFLDLNFTQYLVLRRKNLVNEEIKKCLTNIAIYDFHFIWLTLHHSNSIPFSQKTSLVPNQLINFWEEIRFSKRIQFSSYFYCWSAIWLFNIRRYICVLANWTYEKTCIALRSTLFFIRQILLEILKLFHF